MTFHKAGIEDIDVLVEFRLRFLAERANSQKVMEDDRLKTNLREYFHQAMSEGAFIAWFAKQNGKVVATSGMVIWQMSPNNSVKTGRMGYILNMYTTPETRRQGICTALLEKMIDEAKSLGLSRVHLHALKLGEGVYRKRGFTEPGDIELVMRLD